MKLIVGLGNPGAKYEKTRHNLGFMVVDALSDGKWKKTQKLQSDTSRKAGAILAKPQIFMNKSGLVVSRLIHYYRLELSELIVIHDDLDLPFGKVRIQLGGYSAGHKGVESIVEVFGSQDFIRARIGIGRPEEKINVEDYVLEEFSRKEQKQLPQIIRNSTQAISAILEVGLEEAQNKFN